jgi:hypothetical protein
MQPVRDRKTDADSPRFVWAVHLSEGAATARIPIAVTGSWVKGASEFAIDLDDLRSMRENFARRQNGEINVDYDHACEQPQVALGGPIPSAGRVVRLESLQPFTSGRHILYGEYQPTARARDLIKSREYRYISPAINWAAKDKATGNAQGATLTSIALTNRPFLEEMPEIYLSDQGFKFVKGESMKKLSLKYGADGSHQVFDGGDLIGEIAGAHLKEYAATRLGIAGGGSPNSIGEIARVHSSSSPNPKLAEMAETLASERHIPYSQALSEVAREHPDLAREARAEVLGREP